MLEHPSFESYSILSFTQAKIQAILITSFKSACSIEYQLYKKTLKIFEYSFKTQISTITNKKMAFNKVFIILLALAASTLAMPVNQVDQTMETKIETTSASIDSTTTVTTIAEDQETGADDSEEKIVTHEESDDLEVVKRSIEEDSNAADADDLETAAGTNVLRPLFVYRQQVAYRQRIRDAYRRGNRRF